MFKVGDKVKKNTDRPLYPIMDDVVTITSVGEYCGDQIIGFVCKYPMASVACGGVPNWFSKYFELVRTPLPKNYSGQKRVDNIC